MNLTRKKRPKIIGSPKEWVDKFGVKAKKNTKYMDAYNKIKKVKRNR